MTNDARAVYLLENQFALGRRPNGTPSCCVYIFASNEPVEYPALFLRKLTNKNPATYQWRFWGCALNQAIAIWILFVEVDWDRRDVLARADLINTLASAKLKLEQGLLIMLERADTSKPIISLATLAAEP